MDAINVAAVFQEARDADLRFHTRSQVQVDYFIIPYIPTFIRLSHLYQEFYFHCIAIIIDRGWIEGVVGLYQHVGEGTWGEHHLMILGFFYLSICHLFSDVLCFFFKWLEHDSCCVCFFVYYLFSFSLVRFTRSYWSIEIVVSVM